ncbi:MAG: NUDIX domain-containing protein [Myxococcota bacterium]
MSSTLHSAALALVRGDGEAREVLLVHPGGPFWAKKEAGAWSLPKGVLEPGEDALSAALREFCEETGAPRPAPPYEDLGEVVQKSGKRVRAFAARGDFEVTTLRSNDVELEHPKGSGKLLRFPEVDRAAWCDLERARVLANPAQVPLIERAMRALLR